MAGQGGVLSYARVLPAAFAAAIAATLLGVISFLVNDSTPLGARAAGSATPAAACATLPAGCTPMAPVTITGITEGGILRGTVSVTATLSRATTNPLIFTLTGPRAATRIVYAPPYRFGQGDLWNTRAVPDGAYTLAVSLGDPPAVQTRVRFTVRNGTR